MKKIIVSVFVFYIGLFIISCKEDSCCATKDKSSGEEWRGTWLLYESGYSPGAGYVTNPVPADPAQTITFGSNNIFSSNALNLEDYKFYQVSDDTLAQQGKILSLYKKAITVPASDPAQSILHYSLTWNDNSLKLSYRFCIEGCHMAFTKME